MGSEMCIRDSLPAISELGRASLLLAHLCCLRIASERVYTHDKLQYECRLRKSACHNQITDQNRRAGAVAAERSLLAWIDSLNQHSCRENVTMPVARVARKYAVRAASYVVATECSVAIKAELWAGQRSGASSRSLDDDDAA